MIDTLRFGLIGCGQHGRLLTSALSQVPGTALVACSDTSADSLGSFPGEGLGRYADYREMLERERLDAAIVVTAHGALAAAAAAVADSGLQVFCEKPAGLTAAQARPAVEAARRAGVNLMVGYVLRYDSLRRQLHDLLRAGAVGEIAYVVAGKGGAPLTGWMAGAEVGGQLLWVGSHLVDQVNWLLARPAERVYAEMVRRPDTGVDQTTVFTVRYAGGVLAHFDCSQAAHLSYDYVEVVGSRGRVRAEWVPRRVLSVHSEVVPEYREPTTIHPVKNDMLTMYVDELREFVASVREQRPPAITGEDGLRALELLDAVRASAEQGAPVKLRPEEG